jgi:hypothetical protein
MVGSRRVDVRVVGRGSLVVNARSAREIVACRRAKLWRTGGLRS